MRGQDTTAEGLRQPSDQPGLTSGMRGGLRAVALRNALAKRKAGVPTYSVPEVAALLSVSAEYVYRLIKADAFPVLLMALGGRQGRYVVPAAAVEQLLGQATEAGNTVDVAEWTAARAGGAA
jgi:predicted DNA-binding transcriptional regulator AlpA